MDNSNLHRRNFLSRMSLTLAGLITIPIEKTIASVQQKRMNKMTQTHPILSVKPMGFVWETADPFLFCVHHEDNFPRGNSEMGPAAEALKGRSLGDDFIIKDGFRMYHGQTIPGFPGHPHRGFETITVVRNGIVDHADSMGAAGRYGNGDVQWMTAGKGVQHSEMFPLIHEHQPNPMELFQIWLNLPAQSKMVQPHFKMLWAESIPKYKQTDQLGKHTIVEVIAGNLHGHHAVEPPPDSWAANASHEVAVWNIKMDAGAEWVLPKASKGVNRTIYFYEGKELNVAAELISAYQAIALVPEIDVMLKAGTEAASILLLQGKPIGEPVIQYGPFVMNTKEEIHQAFEDYHRTQFGGWPWERADQVHPRTKGRFAKHADGTEEVKKS